MGKFIRTFLFSLVFFTIAAVAGFTAYSKIFNSDAIPIPEDQLDKLNLDASDPFERGILESGRINALLLGVNEGMTDTIILCSLDIESKKMDMISIPRDTYYHRIGYNGPADRKINAVYSSQGVKETVHAVQEILGDKIPIHQYGIIDYKGVEKMVDLLGGVEVDVPMNMRYDDPYDKPPLKIRISKGRQVLNGENAMGFLRFRKNNDGSGYPEGDLGRIKAQQQFVTSFLKKSIGLKLPNIIKTGLNNVETDMTMSEGLSIATKIVGMNSEDITTHMLPGEAEYRGNTSYFFHDEVETEELIKEIYGKEESALDDDM